MSECTIPLPELTGCRERGDGLPQPPLGSMNVVDTVATSTPETVATYPVLPFDQTTTTATYEIGTPPEPIALPATGMGPEIALVASLMVLTGWALRRMTRKESR